MIIKKHTIVVLFVVAFSFVMASVNSVLAGSGENISGWAYSENIGWISFNGDNVSGGADYGVDIDLVNNGLMSGYAWSENIGWITFNNSQLGGCPSGVCEARYNTGTSQITGWARAYRAIVTEGQSLGGWDGWIKLNGAWGNISIDTSAGPPYELRGWASSSADPSTGVVGWISFNGDNVSGGADYSVVLNESINQSPVANALSVSQPNYCTYPPGALFSWTFNDSGDTQSAYQIQLDDDSDFGADLVWDSGKTSSSGASASTPSGIVQYGRTYYWRLMVWDSSDASSGWTYPPSPAGSPTASPGGSFSTPLHAYPNVEFLGASAFSRDPSSFSAGDKVDFANNSNCYDISNNLVDCVSAGGSWLWQFNPDGAPGSSSVRNPQDVVFGSTGSKSVSLTGTDELGQACSTSINIDANIAWPFWKEITPR